MQPALASSPANDQSPGRVWLARVLLLVLGVLPYVPALRAPFVFDSMKLATETEYRVPRAWWTVLQGSRSLTDWTFTTQYSWTGPSPLAYVLVNIAIHLLAALTLLALARRTLSLPSMPVALRRSSVWWAFAIAAIWAVHPLQTQAVTYHVQRYESMMALMYLLTLYCVVRGATSPRSIGWYIAAIVVSLVGMSCKSVMVTIPLVALLYDYSTIARSWREVFRKRWALHLGLLATAVWGVYLERSVFNSDSPQTAGLALKSVSSWEYLRTQAQIILHYIGLAFWPSTLCIDYAWPVEHNPWQIYLPGLVILALIGVSVYLLWKYPPLGFLGLAFFIVLAPTSTIIPIVDLAFEHRLYLPLAALVALVVACVYLVTENTFDDAQARRLMRICLLALVVGGLMVRCALRNVDYVDPVRLWTKVLRVNPQNDRAYNFLAQIAAQRGKPQEAIKFYERALEIQESYAAHVNLANLYAGQGELETAIAHAQRAIQILPYEPSGYFNLAICYEKRGRERDAAEAYRKAINCDAHFAIAHNNLALLLSKEGKTDEAISHFEQAIRSDPQYNTAIVNLGEKYRQRGELELAIEQYGHALRVQPNYPATHLFLGQALAAQGDEPAAVNSMRRAIQLAPNWKEPKLRLAWLLATSADEKIRNAAEAVRLAESAIENLEDPSLEEADVLAAAYAAAGRLSDAEAVLRAAIERAAEVSPEVKLRLESYRERRPFSGGRIPR